MLNPLCNLIQANPVLDGRTLDGHREFRHGARNFCQLVRSEFGDGEAYCFIERVGVHIHYMRYSVRAGE